jgi:hypothetical protein
MVDHPALSSQSRYLARTASTRASPTPARARSGRRCFSLKPGIFSYARRSAIRLARRRVLDLTTVRMNSSTWSRDFCEPLSRCSAGLIGLFSELTALQMHFNPGRSRYVRNFIARLQRHLEKCDRQGVFALGQRRQDRRPQGAACCSIRSLPSRRNRPGTRSPAQVTSGQSLAPGCRISPSPIRVRSRRALYRGASPITERMSTPRGLV